MEIKFQSKEESNRINREAFLNLPPAKRVRSFIRMMQQMKSFKIKEEDTWKQRKKNNFIIIIKDGVGLE